MNARKYVEEWLHDLGDDAAASIIEYPTKLIRGIIAFLSTYIQLYVRI